MTNKPRSSGLLAHLTSLPSPFGIGDLGIAADRFIRFLDDAGQSYWQILPLCPTDLGSASSPYSSISAFAGNVLLISPEQLREQGLVTDDDLDGAPTGPENKVDYAAVTAFKDRLISVARQRLAEHPEIRNAFSIFCEHTKDWLEDFCLFAALKEHFEGKAWTDWPEPLRDRQDDALAEIRGLLADRIEHHRLGQYLFFSQFESMHEHCKDAGIKLIGDLPIYVNHDSVDVWSHPDYFKLDRTGRPTVVAGVPPDYFSPTGQLWGNPVYDWDHILNQDDTWWLRRMDHALTLFDVVRIDHFRGFAAYWEIPADHETAIDGRWADGPGTAFFDRLTKRFNPLPVIAEDLGIITDDVRALMAQYEIPGCRVLLFAFGDDLWDNPHKPHNHVENCVVYTGTHDNNTAAGWFAEETGPDERRRLEDTLGHATSPEQVSGDLCRLALSSKANLSILPIQDVLGLDGRARMNRPATIAGNWKWRLTADQLTAEIAQRLRAETIASGRHQ
ncbi:MAG: 4-alpha-glucanotransferase [Deltaproteobacteria bacterium]|nr:4-alpha-glucanotransferase [Deltaproteobacteria bacterium]